MHQKDDTTVPYTGFVRRFLMHYLVVLMVLCEALYVLCGLLGIDFDSQIMAWLVPSVLPISLALFLVAVEGREAASQEPAASMRWALLGALMFGIWAGLYFLVGRLVDPTRVRFLPIFLESRIAFEPSYSLLYILLYPIFLLPFFVVRDRVALRRLIAADLLMFVTCTLAFLAFPVAFDRPGLPPPPYDFGTWVLSLVRGSDPAWNCLPSEHCAAAMIAALAIWESNRKLGIFALFSTFLIGVSTLYTKQHYVVDVMAGYIAAFTIHWTLRWSKSFEPEGSPPGGEPGEEEGVLDRLVGRLFDR
jgi:membrane-associated phospholipid phosphatase